MLPAIATLHTRQREVRTSGATLATISGTTALVVGLAASVALDLRPAALIVLGAWWWTSGKMWAETGVLPRAFGVATATLAVLALLGVVALVTMDGLLSPVPAAGQAWTLVQVVLGLWLLALAALLPSR